MNVGKHNNNLISRRASHSSPKDDDLSESFVNKNGYSRRRLLGAVRIGVVLHQRHVVPLYVVA